MIIWITPVLACLVCILLVPLVKQYCFRVGRLAIPRADRYHQKPTPTLGGVAIFIAFMASLFGVVGWVLIRAGVSAELIAFISQWRFLLGSIVVFGLGIYDDYRRISPQAKLIGQIVAAVLVVSTGLTTEFFTPRLENPVSAQMLNSLLTIFWLVGITNAINLLDNMDGLAGGIALICAVILGVLFWQADNVSLLVISLALLGSIGGFLLYNYPPATIFMGDSGSMFLGFTLAGLAITRQPQASNVLAVLGVPTLIFLLPIMDTLFVTITRTLRGESPVKGGLDHTSHRMIAFGLGEKQVLWIFYAAALIAGGSAVLIESAEYQVGLIVLPVLILAFAIFSAYLGGVAIDRSAEKTFLPEGEANGNRNRQRRFLRILLDLTFKRRILEVGLDFIIITLSFYMAFLLRFGTGLTQEQQRLFIQALTIILGSSFISLQYFGVYRSYWRYVSLDNLVSYAKSALGAVLISSLLIYFIYDIRSGAGSIEPLDAYPPTLFIFFGLFLFSGLAISRFSFRLIDRLTSQRLLENFQRVVILGASDRGEIALRWILMNPGLEYRPVGFIDKDILKVGRYIHGVEVVGHLEQLNEILDRYGVHGLLLAEDFNEQINLGKINQVCKQHGCWVKRFHLEFETVG